MAIRLFLASGLIRFAACFEAVTAGIGVRARGARFEGVFPGRGPLCREHQYRVAAGHHATFHVP